MLIDLTPDQIIDLAETMLFVIPCDQWGTHFQIARSGETPRSTRLVHEYRRKIAGKTVRIYAEHKLTQKFLQSIVYNPFKFEDEHPFRH